MIIRNKKTGETRNVDPSQLSSFGITTPTATPTPTPTATKQPSTGSTGNFTSPLPGGNTYQEPAIEGLMKLFFPQAVAGGKAVANGELSIGGKNTKGDIVGSAKEALKKTMKLAEVGGKMGVEAASYANPEMKASSILPRMGVNATIGAGNTAINDPKDPVNIGVSALISSLLPEGVRGSLTIGHEGIPKLLAQATDKMAAKTKTLFPVEDLYRLLEEKASKVTGEGSRGSMANVLNTMEKEAGVAKPGSGLTYSGEIMNDKRKIFNKAYKGKDNNVLDKAQTLMAEIFREAQTKDNPKLGDKLSQQKFFTYDLPKLLESFPVGGKFAKKGISLATGGVSKVTPSPTGDIGNFLQSLTRILSQNSYGTAKTLLAP